MLREFLERIRDCPIKVCLPNIREPWPWRRLPETMRDEAGDFGIQEYVTEAQMNPEYDVVEDAIDAEDADGDGRLSYTYVGEGEDVIRILPLPFARGNASNRLSRSSNVLNGVEYRRYIMFNESSSRATGDSQDPDMIAGDSGLDYDFRVSG